MTQHISPPFWGTADGDVRLWVPFNGNVSTDISAYNHGAGTNTGATISGGQLSLSGTTVQTIVWGPVTTLGRPGNEPWTLEAFYTWTSSASTGAPGLDLKYQIGASAYHWFSAYDSAGKVQYETPDFGQQGVTVANVLAGVGKVHVAMVHPAGPGVVTMRFYVNGAQVFTYSTGGPGPSSANGTISIGKLNGGTSLVGAMDDIRLTMRELYTGTSFTPPTSPL